jgi:hypothetical protein
VFPTAPVETFDIDEAGDLPEAMHELADSMVVHEEILPKPEVVPPDDIEQRLAARPTCGATRRVSTRVWLRQVQTQIPRLWPRFLDCRGLPLIRQTNRRSSLILSNLRLHQSPRMRSAARLS